MKWSLVVLYFLLGMLGVWFGGVCLGLILDRYSSGDLETGDMATWAAAYGTICTLGFLINQHIQLRHSQDKERETREAHERKQQEMWVEQRELLKIQKQQIHKELFFNKLDEIEKSISDTFYFYDRGQLHDSLFNLNGLDLVINESQPVVKNIQTSFDRIRSSLELPVSESKIKNFLQNLHDIYKFYLLLDPGAPSTIGDVYGSSRIKDHQFSVINIFDIEKQLYDISNVFWRLCKFGGYQLVNPYPFSNITSEFKVALIKFAISRNESNSSYRLLKDKHNRLLFLTQAYDLFINDDSYLSTFPAISALESVFSSSTELLKCVESDWNFQGLLKLLRREVYEGLSMNEENDKYVDLLDDIIRTL
ncbi:MAG: hypothetical protein AAGJ78_04840 [Pseudomonadota bacterium]